MKQTFHHKLINGPFEDPSLFVRFLWQQRAVLFDAGWIGRLEQGDLMKISDVFITHAHIDHFIGFDAILRALLRRDSPLNVYGPPYIIDCVEGKLRGYSWNLISEYPLKIDVFGIAGNTMKHAGFYAKNRFYREEKPDIPFAGTILDAPSFRIKTVSLDHDIQCMGYSIEEDFHINIDKAKLAEMGLPVGPWLSELKDSIRKNVDREFIIEGRSYGLSEVKNVASITKGQKVSYIMDCAPSEENVEKAAALANGSDTLYCEAYFLHADVDRAVERKHLTARLAGVIARRAKVKNLVVTHFSPKYRLSPDELINEALDEWKG